MNELELREFIREQTLRWERASQSTNAWLRVADQRTQEMIRRGDEIIAELREQRGELREQRIEFREESRAQRAALFAILDRLNPSDPPPAPG